MSELTPTTHLPCGVAIAFKATLFTIPLLLGPSSAFSGNGSDGLPPLPVSGISGVTFLTADLPSVERFYGKGAGFAEVPNGHGSTRFAVGAHQWLEFDVVHAADWTRRLQYVTLESPSLEKLGGALRDRGVIAQWIGSETGPRTLQFEDPAGNQIRVAEPWTAPSIPAATGAAFSAHLQHFGFAVARPKAEAAIGFYRGTLGLPEVARGAGPDGRLAMIKFRLPGTRNELVELIIYDPPLNKWAAGAFDHVNFEVGAIDDAYRALHKGGIANRAKHLPTVNAERLWAIDIIDPELTRMEVQVLAPASEPVGTVSRMEAPLPRALFDGSTLAGWEGNTGNWRVEDGALVAGALDRMQPHNEFLATLEDFGNFDLRLQYRVEGTEGFVNGGVQFWSQRVPGNFEVSGFQADLGADTDGNLYDESRRNRNLATAPVDVRARALKPGAWNDYRIRAEGAHIQIWLNGLKTVDYTEPDTGIALRGKFALQIHGGARTKVSYRNLAIEALP